MDNIILSHSYTHKNYTSIENRKIKINKDDEYFSLSKANLNFVETLIQQYCDNIHMGSTIQFYNILYVKQEKERREYMELYTKWKVNPDISAVKRHYSHICHSLRENKISENQKPFFTKVAEVLYNVIYEYEQEAQENKIIEIFVLTDKKVLIKNKKGVTENIYEDGIIYNVGNSNVLAVVKNIKYIDIVKNKLIELEKLKSDNMDEKLIHIESKELFNYLTFL